MAETELHHTEDFVIIGEGYEVVWYVDKRTFIYDSDIGRLIEGEDQDGKEAICDASPSFRLFDIFEFAAEHGFFATKEPEPMLSFVMPVGFKIGDGADNVTIDKAGCRENEPGTATVSWTDEDTMRITGEDFEIVYSGKGDKFNSFFCKRSD
jgi:hypothetical protein